MRFDALTRSKQKNMENRRKDEESTCGPKTAGLTLVPVPAVKYIVMTPLMSVTDVSVSVRAFEGKNTLGPPMAEM